MATSSRTAEHGMTANVSRRPGPVPSAARPDPRSSVSAIVTALASAQKPGAGAGAYGRWVNRPAGRVLAAVSYKVGLTPNAVTGISALLSFSGIAAIALLRPQWWTGVLIALCLAVGYAFDSADGQLARLRGGGSPVGEWLDHMVDAAKISSLHVAVLIGAYRFTDLTAGWLLVPIGYVVVAAVMFFGMILIDQLRRQFAADGRAVERPTPGNLRSLLVIPADYGLFCVAFLLAGSPAVFGWVYLAFFVANAVFLAGAARKWFHELRAVPPASR